MALSKLLRGLRAWSNLKNLILYIAHSALDNLDGYDCFVGAFNKLPVLSVFLEVYVPDMRERDRMRERGREGGR